MRVHVLQHVSFEGIGSMSSWLAAHGAVVTYTRFQKSPVLPELRDIDLLIVMGGPMSVNDETDFPWLKQEKAFVRQAIQGGLPVVGICLGAQLIASALGARVYPNREKEIGWFEVRQASSGNGLYCFPGKATVFHWHGETFDLPEGAVCLAKSAACENQAFQVGDRVLGLQFHLETTRESLDSLIGNCRDELVEGNFIQTESTMRVVSDDTYRNIHRLMDDVLDYVTRRL